MENNLIALLSLSNKISLFFNCESYFLVVYSYL